MRPAETPICGLPSIMRIESGLLNSSNGEGLGRLDALPVLAPRLSRALGMGAWYRLLDQFLAPRKSLLALSNVIADVRLFGRKRTFVNTARAMSAFHVRMPESCRSASGPISAMAPSKR